MTRYLIKCISLKDGSIKGTIRYNYTSQRHVCSPKFSAELFETKEDAEQCIDNLCWNSDNGHILDKKYSLEIVEVAL